MRCEQLAAQHTTRPYTSLKRASGIDELPELDLRRISDTRAAAAAKRRRSAALSTFLCFGILLRLGLQGLWRLHWPARDARDGSRCSRLDESSAKQGSEPSSEWCIRGTKVTHKRRVTELCSHGLDGSSVEAREADAQLRDGNPCILVFLSHFYSLKRVL
ncbi:hypothetical protein EVAR_6715_1 [Eumeta japonica]|uniref:Uncharacterized protein n=1 Tax=Eumeta variegata TaxID=151549 RepID=A0A4C1V516_EUMVA|nr:hypothetical protein EVAR_6715_1 [Eumeta japonica]